ncbi:class E sortase [Bifidobacterium bohemicum]
MAPSRASSSVAGSDATAPSGHSHRAARHRRETNHGKTSTFWKVMGLLAELLLTIGLICALYVVWQMWWTGVQSEHTQVMQRQSVSWSAPTEDGTAKIAKPQEGDAPLEPGNPKNGDLMAEIYIPRFGDQWVRNIVQGTDMQALNKHGLGHYTSSQMPGQQGNFAVAGHRNGYGQPLGDVNKFVKGDPIVIRTHDHWYVYEFTDYEIVTPDQVRVVAPNPKDGTSKPVGRLITLTTCEPKYSTATHRWISYGKLKYWAKTADGVPQELTRQDTNGQVEFINNGKVSPVAKIGSLEPLFVGLLVVYAVLFIAAAIAWRWPFRRAVRRGVREGVWDGKVRRKPDPSLYGGLAHLQPGIKPVRLLLVLLLVAAVIVALFQWGFPWAAANIPFLQEMSNYVAVPNT